MQENSFLAVFVAAVFAISLSGIADAQGRGNGNGGGGKPPIDEGPFMIIDLGTLGGEWSTASDINESGEIAGWSQNADGLDVAVIWLADAAGNVGTVEELPALVNGQGCQAYAINDHSAVIGYCRAATGDSRAVLWERDEIIPAMFHITDLEDVYEYDTSSNPITDVFVSDINNDGQIAGGYTILVDDEPVSFPAVLDTDPSPITLPDPLRYAFSINADGDVAGQSVDNISNFGDAIVVLDGSAVVLEKPPANSAAADTINDAGVVAGAVGDHDTHRHIAIWTPDAGGTYALENVGTLGGDFAYAHDINDQEQVVGRSEISTSRKKQNDHYSAFFYENDVMIDLGRLKKFTHFSEAFAINEASIIVGVSGNPNHATRAVAWVPQP